MIAPSPLLVGVLGALTVLVLVMGTWAPAYARRAAIRRRLASAGGGSGRLAVDLGGARRTRSGRRTEMPIRWPITRWASGPIQASGLEITAGELAASALVLAAAAAFVAAVLAGPLAAPVAAALGALAPVVGLRVVGGRRRHAFLAQLTDTAALLASTVRSGHTFLQALESVAADAKQPTRDALQVVVREIGLGSSQEAALERLAARYTSETLDIMVAAINVHTQVGGSLAHVLEEIARTLRERDELQGEIAALTAQQRYSAYVLCSLPICVTVALFFISRDYVSTLLAEPLLRVASAVAAAMVVAGFFIMRRIATIDV